MSEINQKLLYSDDPWIVYRTMIDLQRTASNDPSVLRAKKEMIEHPLIQSLIHELNAWPGEVLASHKSAGQLFHKLSFIADLGITVNDADLAPLKGSLYQFRSAEGLFQLPIQIAVHYGGTGEPTHGWALCDAPLILYSAIKIGLISATEAQPSIEFLMSYVQENGWPCAVSKELGNFRGPGRKQDPCPYVNLIMLKLLALNEQNRTSKEAHFGIQCLLHLWETSLKEHPYIFYMGTDFRKLKAPFIWYDILHVTEVLSLYEEARNDPRFMEMISHINSKADLNGEFTIESVWQAWKEWEFGQKKKPSEWLTFLIARINKRIRK